MLLVVLIGCQVSLDESSTQQETVVVLPATHDFGAQQVQTTSGVYQVTVQPAAGNQSDMVTAVTASCPDFSINATGLPALVFRECEIVCAARDCPDPRAACQTTDIQTYRFDTTFRPAVPGPVSCVVTVTLNNVTNRTVTLSGTGVAPAIAVDVQPGSIGFGDVRIGTDSTRAGVTVRSSGGGALTVSSVTASSGFAILSGPTGGYQLAPGTTQDYMVACHPGGVGGMTGTLEIRSDDPVRPTVGVALTCNGIDSSLDIAPSPAALQTTRVGEPVDARLDLRNIGGASMTLEGVTLTGTGITMVSTPALPQTLATPSDVVQVAVHFDASAQGDASATLTATYDGGRTRSTQISARALSTSMALTPDGEIDFGPVCAGQRRTREFTLIANDLGSFSLQTISDPGAPFTVVAPELPLTVQGAGATQVRFQVTAEPTTPGAATAAAVVHTDIPRAADHTLSLGVLGLPEGVTATPEAIDLGSRSINTTTIGQDVQLSNCGTAPITFSNARIEGDDALDFAIVAEPGSSMISPNGLASWLIVLQAHSVGPKQASFAVDHDGGTATIALTGEGLGDLTAASDGRGSYYACSTGHPIALWPVAAVLALVLRRRARR